MEQTTVLTKLASPLCVFLNKSKDSFTRSDMLKIIEHLQIEKITFHYTGIDGHLKELKLPFGDLELAERILAMGERVDGSSLFRGVIDPSDSDLYVVPKYSTAFINPFDSKSLDFICRFLNSKGELASFAPDNILNKAAKLIKKETGFDLNALMELEFYLIDSCDAHENAYNQPSQQGYHSGFPFAKNGNFIDDMLRIIEKATGSIKYAHAEVGSIDKIESCNPYLNNHRAEQYELEFRTAPIAEMGDNIAISRWLIRNLAARSKMLATFAPKLMEGHAGSGMHVHVELMRNGRNMMLEGNKLSVSALKIIGGLVKFAPSLSAFGNMTAASFLRLVPNQEAPTKICWSHSNRSSLIRIPLGWKDNADLSSLINPEDVPYLDERGSQTAELRSPDGSGHAYLLLAGIAASAVWGLQNPEASLKEAKESFTEGNIFKQDDLAEKLRPLPRSCEECADILSEDRSLYESTGLFPASVINGVIEQLRNERDKTLAEQLASMAPEQKKKTALEVMQRDLHKN